jgi:hypothetical protein
MKKRTTTKVRTGMSALRAASFSAQLLVGLRVLVAAEESADGQPPQDLSIRWGTAGADTNRMVVEVFGLSAKTLQELRRVHWSPGEWQRLLSVFAEQGDVIADVDLPPMLGAYRLGPTTLRFEPQFPLEPGVRYRAVLRADALPGTGASESGLRIASYQAPVRRSLPTTTVSQVYPSAEVLPENLLKFYVHFSAPMSRGHIYDHIHLRDEAGRDVELPFLEIDEELWDPTLTRLTLFIDPGRIKRGVRPLEEIGPALETGKRYTLVIDRAWADGQGAPLKETFRKTFTVAPPDREPPDPAQWKIKPPRAGRRDSLVLTFSEPMDHSLARRVIQITDASGELVDGQTALEDRERRWTFVPSRPWRRGAHALVVQTSIEDLAGNNIGKPFEVDVLEGVQRRFTNATVKLPFDVP